MFRRAALACALSTACAHPTTPTPPSGTLWVVAPHPDDEVLMATEALREAVRAGTDHQVVIVTNGDFTCTRDGWGRQRESIAALAAIGVTEEHVHFLGYPDGWLANLGSEPLAPIPRTAEDGTCGTGTGTYGRRGAEGMDVHRAQTGAPGPYAAAGVVEDLAALFRARPPSEIHLPHFLDAHPDHAMTYAFVRRALEALEGPPPPLVRHVVHVGPCWPASDPAGACIDPSPALDGTPLPALPPPLTAYLPDRITPSDAALRRGAIERYVTQLEGPAETSWLASFARTTEHGFTEHLVRRGERLETTAASPGRVEGESWTAPVALVGTANTPLVLGDAADGYSVTVTDDALVLARLHGEVEELRRMERPAWPAGAEVTLSVIPVGAFAQLEVRGPDGFVLGAIDAAPRLAGAGASGGRLVARD